jgi:hypothetical protein
MANDRGIRLAAVGAILAVCILAGCGETDTKPVNSGESLEVVGHYDGEVTSMTKVVHFLNDIDSGWVELDSILSESACLQSYRLIIRGRDAEHNCDLGSPCPWDTLIVWDTGINLEDTLINYDCTIEDIRYVVAGTLKNGFLRGSASSTPISNNGPHQGCCEHEVTFSVSRGR